MIQSYKYVIVGTGPAGLSAIEVIRERDPVSSILIIGKESVLPYKRPLLTKNLLLDVGSVDDILLRPPDFFKSNRINVMLDTKIVSLDRERQIIADSERNSIRYEKLLLATGGVTQKLRIRGDAADQIQYYSNMEDCLRIKELTDHAKEIVLIGGGFVNTELAETFVKLGKKVTMVFPQKNVLSRIFPPELATRVTQRLIDNNIRIINNDIVFELHQTREGYVLRTGNNAVVDADTVIAGIGILPDLVLASNSGLLTSTGIVVDEFLRTTDERIFAAGDNTFFPSPSLDKYLRIEHWDNAVMQGRIAGGNMSGAEKLYIHQPYFSLEIFDLYIEAVGDIDSRFQTSQYWKRNHDEGFIHYMLNNRIQGVLAWNLRDSIEEARKLISSEYSTNPSELRERA